MNEYNTISIISVAAKCGIEINGNTDKTEVAVRCPFCGDHRHHLYLNTIKNQFFCHRCGEYGSSITLYSKLIDCTNRTAYHELTSGGMVYNPIYSNKPENEPRPLIERHSVYNAFLDLLTLSEKHRNNLLERGLDYDAIVHNKYRTAPGTILADSITESLSKRYDLIHIPGFYTHGGQWRMALNEGMYVPIRNEAGHIQGLQIRLDNTKDGNKYKWLSSRFRENGAKAYSWLHTANWSDSKTVFITEGALKADIAANISNDCYIAVAGVNSIGGLTQFLNRLNIQSVHEAFDADKYSNCHVSAATDRLYHILADAGIACHSFDWDRQFRGVDDYYGFCRWFDSTSS